MCVSVHAFTCVHVGIPTCVNVRFILRSTLVLVSQGVRQRTCRARQNVIILRVNFDCVAINIYKKAKLRLHLHFLFLFYAHGMSFREKNSGTGMSNNTSACVIGKVRNLTFGQGSSGLLT